jgi:hypothetical protein
MIMKRTARERTSGLGKTGHPKFADIEYRVVWNAAKQEWNVFRNGVATNISARKKEKSAVDSAIREAKAELKAPEAIILVTCVKGREIATVWRGP